MGSAWSYQSALIACLLRGRRNHRVATRGSATRLAGRRQHDLWRDSRVACPLGDVGNYRCPILPRLHLYWDRRGDGV